MLYVKNSVKYVWQIQSEKPGAHIVLLRTECNKKFVYLASIYRTYKLTGHESHLQAFQEQIDVLQLFMYANQGENIIIMGDMNLDEQRRSDRSYNLHQLYQIWDEFERERNLTQMVKFSTWTRHAVTLCQSIIDHVYTCRVCWRNICYNWWPCPIAYLAWLDGCVNQRNLHKNVFVNCVFKLSFTLFIIHNSQKLNIHDRT